MAQFDGFLSWQNAQGEEPYNGGLGNSKSSERKKIELDKLLWNDPTSIRPYLYDVYMTHSDTSDEIVMSALQQFFHKPTQEAAGVVRILHQSGKGICGTYTREVAETKVEEINRFFKENHVATTCMMEKGNKHAI